MLLFVHSMKTWLARRVPWSNSRQAWRERGSWLLVLTCALALWWFASVLSPLAQIFLWAGLLLVTGYLLRRSWVQLFGPMLFFEMMRAGRKRRHIIFRIVYALLLLFILFCAYSSWFLDRRESTWLLIQGVSLRARDVADFTASFFFIFMAVQFLTVFWLTPAYTAGAITVEKERQTLDALLATDLRSHEIVLSTYVSRLANLLMLLLVGLPILALLQFMGGVDPNLVLAGFAASGLTMISLAGLGTMNSLFARRPRDAVLRTYLAAVIYLVVTGASWLLLLPNLHLADFPSTDNWTSPVELEDVVEWGSIGNLPAVIGQLAYGIQKGGHLDQILPPMLTKYAWFHGLLAVGCCVLSIVRFRAKALEPRESPTDKSRRVRLSRWNRWRHWRARPSVTARPILWKEMFVDALGRRRLWGKLSSGILLAGVFLPAVHMLCFFGRIRPLNSQDHLVVLLNYWVRGASSLIGCAMLVGVAVRAAGSVSGERDRQTLDGLLATPMHNHTILWEKWLGCIFSQRRPWFALAMVWALGWYTGALHPLAMSYFVVAWLAYAAFVAGLGMWFSVANRATLKSVFGTLCTMVLVLGILLLAAFDIPESWMPKWLYAYWPLVTLPPSTLGFLAFSPANYEDWLLGKLELNYLPLVFIVQFAIWWAFSIVLVCLATIRFRVVTGRTSGVPNPPCSIPEMASFSREAQPSAALLLITTPKLKETPEDDNYEEISGPGWPKRLVSATLLLLPLCLLVAWYGYQHWAGEGLLREAIANLDRSDPRWRLLDIEADREIIPDEDNSSLIIREVKKSLPREWETGGDVKFYERFMDLTPENQLNDRQIQDLTNMFERFESTLMMARRLADMPRGRHPIHWSDDGLSTLLPYTQDARTLANLLRYDALLRSQERHADGALESVRGILNAGRSIGDEPTLISMLVRIAIRGVFAAELERALAQGEPSEDGMRKLQSLMETEEKTPLLLIGMLGERGMFDRLLENLEKGKVGIKQLGMFWGGGEELLLLSGSLKGNRVVFLDLMTANVEAAKLPVEQQEAEFKRIETSLAQKPHLIRMLAPAGMRIEQAYWRSQAQLRAAIVALAVERFRREHGRWPNSLAELVPSKLPKIYTDPYDGQPLRYRKNKEGVVIYSVGPDKIDDGGKFDRLKVTTPGADIGIQLWDPDKRRQPPAAPKSTGEDDDVAAPDAAVDPPADSNDNDKDK
jgi:ABC-type transport system involved in multi-copper enzyme maturation permease subunit